jgi:hypothetical protein
MPIRCLGKRSTRKDLDLMLAKAASFPPVADMVRDTGELGGGEPVSSAQVRVSGLRGVLTTSTIPPSIVTRNQAVCYGSGSPRSRGATGCVQSRIEWRSVIVPRLTFSHVSASGPGKNGRS